MRHAVWTRLGIAMTALVAAFAVTGAGYHHSVTSGPENVAAAQAVAALTGPPLTSTAAIPDDFAATMGYQPVVRPGPDGADRLVKPSGECSWSGSTRYDFTTACAAHDLGYDLMRYATAHGGELGPWARQAIDVQLAVDVRARCAAQGTSFGCGAMAKVIVGAVEFNSWRQGNGNPGREAGGPYLAAGAFLVAGVAGPPVVSLWRRRALRQSAASTQRGDVVVAR